MSPDDKVFESFIPDFGGPHGTLQCAVEGEELVIRIQAKTLAFAATHLEDGGDDMRYFKVANAGLLLRDVARELCRDDEGGGNSIEQMLDSAIVAAAENGSEAII